MPCATGEALPREASRPGRVRNVCRENTGSPKAWQWSEDSVRHSQRGNAHSGERYKKVCNLIRSPGNARETVVPGSAPPPPKQAEIISSDSTGRSSPGSPVSADTRSETRLGGAHGAVGNGSG